VHAGIVGFIARIRRAGIAVIAVWRRSCLTTVDQVADFGSVAMRAVVADGIVGQVATGIVRFVARIDCAGHPIVAIGRCARLARTGDTGLVAIAILLIVAIAVRTASTGWDTGV
jgi:regulator of RNase E activity RraA